MLPDAAIPDRAYQDALRWLYGLSPNIRTAAQIVADHPRKLGRMRALLAEIGNPEARFASVLVAGTKGKGSIAANAEAILRAAGLRTGLVTSPHLMSWCERTRIAGDDIAPATVGRLMPLVRAAMGRLATRQPALGQPTTFEAGLALSLLAFAEAGIEVAIVEAGVGGLHDATNVLNPLAVALGPISYDHTATLGTTLAAIAQEEAGVFRAGRLAVVAQQPAEAHVVVEQAAGTSGARLERIETDWLWQPDAEDACRSTFGVSGPRGHFARLTSPLLGRHQRENAAAAVALATGALDVLAGGPATADDGHAPDPSRVPGAAGAGDYDATAAGGPAVSSATAPPADHVPVARSWTPADIYAAVRRGLGSVRWSGRLQVLRQRPWLVLDGAHNGDSAARLAEALRACFPATRCRLVFGTSVGKDVSRMLDALLPVASDVTLTRSHHERSVPLDELAAALRERGIEPASVADVHEAVSAALQRSGPDDLVIVTGSLFVVGEALEGFGETPGTFGDDAGERHTQ